MDFNTPADTTRNGHLQFNIFLLVVLEPPFVIVVIVVNSRLALVVVGGIAPSTLSTSSLHLRNFFSLSIFIPFFALPLLWLALINCYEDDDDLS